MKLTKKASIALEKMSLTLNYQNSLVAILLTGLTHGKNGDYLKKFTTTKGNLAEDANVTTTVFMNAAYFFVKQGWIKLQKDKDELTVEFTKKARNLFTGEVVAEKKKKTAKGKEKKVEKEVKVTPVIAEAKPMTDAEKKAERNKKISATLKKYYANLTPEEKAGKSQRIKDGIALMPLEKREKLREFRRFVMNTGYQVWKNLRDSKKKK